MTARNSLVILLAAIFAVAPRCVHANQPTGEMLLNLGDADFALVVSAATQMAANGEDLGYRSAEAPEERTFDVDFVPTAATTKLAVFSDDGVNVLINGQSTNVMRKGQGQALPDIANSLRPIEYTFTPGQTYQIRIEYSNIIYTGGGDIDGCKLFAYDGGGVQFRFDALTVTDALDGSNSVTTDGGHVPVLSVFAPSGENAAVVLQAHVTPDESWARAKVLWRVIGNLVGSPSAGDFEGTAPTVTLQPVDDDNRSFLVQAAVDSNENGVLDDGEPTHLVQVDVVKIESAVDLDVDSNNDGKIDAKNDGADDPIESYSPGLVIRINQNGDKEGQDEIKPLRIFPRRGTGTLTLQISGAGAGATGRIRIWKDEKKTEPLDLPATWNLGANQSPPAQLFIDGTEKGPNSLRLTLEVGTETNSDDIAFIVSETTSYSPSRSTAYAWEPFAPTEISAAATNEAVALTAGAQQGFVWTRFRDEAGAGFNEISFDDLKSLKNAGLLVTYTHGAPGALWVVKRETEAEVKAFFGKQPNEALEAGIAVQPYQGGFYGAILSNWIEKNWKENRDGNRAIGLFLGCDTAVDAPANANFAELRKAVIDKAGGREAFGYKKGVPASAVEADVPKLLGNMNGSLGGGANRTARYAFLRNEYTENFVWKGNGWTTLCPAPEQTFPKPGSSLYTDATGMRRGFGCVLFDTYLDESQSPAQAVSKLDGGGALDAGPRWFAGNQTFGIGFEFSLMESALLTMRAHSAFCVNKGSADGRRKLDADSVAPNGDGKNLDWTFGGP